MLIDCTVLKAQLCTMEWRDTGILLSLRKHGETSAIAELFTPGHGRHAGMVRGASSRKLGPVLQPGAQLDVQWRARLDSHLGSYAVELQRSRAAQAMGSRLALAGLNAVVALLGFCLPEREPHDALYRRSEALLDLLGQDEIWPLAYLRWELALLEDMGFGLDLTTCAVTGAQRDLCYVSPKSGRAVSALGAGRWADKLLPLPPVLQGHGAADDSAIIAALRVTGYFLETKLAPAMGTLPLPEARARWIDRLERIAV